MTAQGNSPVEGQQSRPGTASPPPRPTPRPSRRRSRASSWGRVEEDGTVYVRTADGERAVGQYPEGTPEEALAFFTRRFDALEFEVQLLEQRVRAEALTPGRGHRVDQAGRGPARGAQRRRRHRGLSARLDALGPLIGLQRNKRREERARQLEESRTRKEQIVGEAEKISQGKDWRNGVNRLRDLLEEWKALPRLDKKSDDELWHRFSGARTAYTRRRKAHFAELSEMREGARVVKEKLLKEAESLSDSTEWGPTSTRYRELMQDWKAAGAAPRDVEEDALAALPHRPGRVLRRPRRRQRRAGQGVRRQRREEARAARRGRGAGAGQGPRRRQARLPRHQRALGRRRQGPPRRDQVARGPHPQGRAAIRSVEDDKWKRSDPEKSARADDMLGQLERAIAGIEADLEKARAAGNEKKIKELEENLASRQAFLEMARKAASEFS